MPGGVPSSGIEESLASPPRPPPSSPPSCSPSGGWRLAHRAALALPARPRPGSIAAALALNRVAHLGVGGQRRAPIPACRASPRPHCDGGAPRTEPRTTSKRIGTLVDMHVDHACNVIYAPFCLSPSPPCHLQPLHKITKFENTALDPPGAGISYPPAHDCRPSRTAPGQRVKAISTAVGGKACHDGPSGTPFVLQFPLIARHDRGDFTLFSMRAVGTPQGCLSLVDDHPRTESLTTTPDDGQMDCSDDLAVIGDRPTKGGVAMAPPPRHCHDPESVGLSVNTIVSGELDDQCVDPPFDTQLPIDTTPLALPPDWLDVFHALAAIPRRHDHQSKSATPPIISGCVSFSECIDQSREYDFKVDIDAIESTARRTSCLARSL